MKLRKLKTATVIIATFILTTSTAGAASGPVQATLPAYANVTSVEQGVSALGKVEDEKFIFTLEKAVNWDDRTGFVYSVEAKTEAAKTELMKEYYSEFEYTVKLPAESEIQYDYVRFGEMRDFKTETRRYFFGIVEVQINPQGLPISFGLNAMTGDETYIRTPANDEGTVFSLTKAVASGKADLYITLPMNNVAKELSLLLPTPSSSGSIVELSPMDIFVEKPAAAGNADVFDTGISFRMEDGSVKALDEFYVIDSGNGGNGPSATYRGVSRDVIDLSKFKNIILDGQEYEIAKVVKH